MLIESWDRERVGAVTDLVASVLPEERLSPDELLACCWDDPDPAVVLGADDGSGVIAAVLRGSGEHRVGFVRLVAVDPSCQRRGVGRALLAEAEGWMDDHSVREVRFGAEAPFYLWPGIDVRETPALAFAEAAGYEEAGAVLNLGCPTGMKASPPAGSVLRRVIDEADAVAARALVERRWPWWGQEVERAIDHGSCLVVVDGGGRVTAFGCHSVSRGGWIGPLGTDPDAQRAGLGTAILAGLCADLAAAGYRRAEIPWIGPVGFYAKVADAHVSRVFQTRVRRRR